MDCVGLEFQPVLTCMYVCVFSLISPSGKSTAVSTASSAAEAETTVDDCQDCSSGQYNMGGTECQDCTFGTADTDENPTSPCVNCAAGQYSTWDGTAFGHPEVVGAVISCLECPAGTHDDDENPTSPCSACEAGKWSSTGSSTCANCNAGQGSWPGVGVNSSHHVHSQGCVATSPGSQIVSFSDLRQMGIHASAHKCAELCADVSDPWIRSNNRIAIKSGECYCISGTVDVDALQPVDDGECDTVCAADLGSMCGSAETANRYSLYVHMPSTDGCQACAAGQYSAGGAPCLNCDAGRYQTAEASTSPCAACDFGSWSNASIPATGWVSKCMCPHFRDRMLLVFTCM